MEAERERVASVPVKPGMFALRYIASASDKPPRVYVSVSPSSLEDVQVIFVPGMPKGVLGEPKDYALVVAERDCHLQLTVVPFVGGGANARIQLEPLKLGADVEGAPPDTGENATPNGVGLSTAGVCAPAANEAHRRLNVENSNIANDDPGVANTFDRPPAAFALTCHVAQRGDLTVKSGQWIGGPRAPAVIEGISIDWPDRDEGALEYQVLIQGSAGQWSPWVRAGQFAGTRGRRLSLVGLRLRLVGDAGQVSPLTGEAVFLGCPLIRERGHELEFTSLASVDPLVGLRLSWDDRETIALSAAVSDTSREELKREPSANGAGLRIFKSKRSA